MSNFAMIGAAGFIAPRHMRAIKETGHELVAAVDPFDSVGVIDSTFPEARFFTEIERFDRHLEKLRRQGEKVEYVSICSPNYLHDAHVRLALRTHAHAICEKPLVINPWNLDALEDLEKEYETNIYTILQLRLVPSVVELKEKLEQETAPKRRKIKLRYITRRGQWYHSSWKGDEAKSGGIMMNIGIHFFDLMIWLFGDVQEHSISLREADKAAGVLSLENADVEWFLSIDSSDLPKEAVDEGKFAHRTMTIDGEELEFSKGFTDLHTRSYEETLAGRGFRISEARKSLELVYKLRHQELT